MTDGMELMQASQMMKAFMHELFNVLSKK